MEKLKLHTPNITAANIDQIAALFPSCVTEAQDEAGNVTRAIDFDQLRQELSNHIVEGPRERYRIDWPGKREALLAANAPIAKTLRPCREESADFDTTKNLFIEGDNLDALKLLQETYLGKVKMIYIDPPYNTGSDLIYEDDFSESAESFLRRSNQTDENNNRLITNTEANGRFHSDWLSMIYPRLRLARNLLSESGALFISIGNDEIANLRKICDEVFGADNFVECITWNKRIPKNDKGVGNIHDFVLLYVKDANTRHEFFMRKEGLEDIEDLISALRKRGAPMREAEEEIGKLYKKHAYDRGITLYTSFDKHYRLWGKINMSWPNANTLGPRYEVLHPKTGLPVKIPDRGWPWKRETFDKAALREDGTYREVEELHDGSFRCGAIWFSKDERQQPSSITYLDEVSQFLLRSVLSLKSDGGIEVENLFNGKNYFSYPKPTRLLRTLLSAKKTEPGDIVMDFFAGSATTAHALMQMNAEDGIERRFIMVQLPELCDPKTESAKAGFQTIADVAKERLRRAATAVTKEFKTAKDFDAGFRVLKIDTSNMKDVYYAPDQVKQDDLVAHTDNIKEDRTPEDLLFQVLVDWGVDLAMPIAQETIAGKNVFFVDGNALAACFEPNISEDLVKELAKRKPLRAVFRDSSFNSDSVKINIEQIFKLLSPETEIKSL